MTSRPIPTGTGTGPSLLELTAVWPGQWGGALFVHPPGRAHQGESTMLDIIIDIIIAWGADWGDTSD